MKWIIKQNLVVKNESKTEEIKSMLPDYIKVSYIHGQMSPYDIKKNIHELGLFHSINHFIYYKLKVF